MPDTATADPAHRCKSCTYAYSAWLSIIRGTMTMIVRIILSTGTFSLSGSSGSCRKGDWAFSDQAFSRCWVVWTDGTLRCFRFFAGCEAEYGRRLRPCGCRTCWGFGIRSCTSHSGVVQSRPDAMELDTAARNLVWLWPADSL